MEIIIQQKKMEPQKLFPENGVKSSRFVYFWGTRNEKPTHRNDNICKFTLFSKFKKHPISAQIDVEVVEVGVALGTSFRTIVVVRAASHVISENRTI